MGSLYGFITCAWASQAQPWNARDSAIPQLILELVQKPLGVVRELLRVTVPDLNLSSLVPFCLLTFLWSFACVLLASFIFPWWVGLALPILPQRLHSWYIHVIKNNYIDPYRNTKHAYTQSSHQHCLCMPYRHMFIVWVQLHDLVNLFLPRWERGLGHPSPETGYSFKRWSKASDGQNTIEG